MRAPALRKAFSPSSGASACSGLQIVLLEQIVQCRATDPQQLGGVGDIALAASQGVADDLAVSPLACRFEVERLGFGSTGLSQIKVSCADQLGLGNVRELENRVKRAVIMTETKLIGAADLDLAEAGGAEAQTLNLKSAREGADRKVIRHALARSEGNISNTAKLLGISRPTLYDLLKQYDLQT